tara:strand:+ start:370 stop:990 length:621 start_codon:yes stop_codon:yes gene_type:complete
MPYLKNKIAILLLLGGKSTRIGGGIKSLKKINNKKIIDIILATLKPQIDNIIINCNKKEKSITKYDLPIVSDMKQGYLGPLAGIHAGMNWLTKNNPKIDWLITIPGDSPFIPSNLVSCFDNTISSKSKIILAKSNLKIHPVIGAWKIDLLKDLENHINNGTRKILNWAEKYSMEFVNFSNKNYDPLFNINTKEDLIKAELIEKKFF